MKLQFKPGDELEFRKTIQPDEIAQFESGTVHAVYSTFAIARDAEWSGRLFVLQMKEDDEEGIGTFIHVNHRSAAFPGQEVQFISRFERIEENGEIITSFKALQKNRLIAEGQQGQRILPKDKLEAIFRKLQAE